MGNPRTAVLMFLKVAIKFPFFSFLADSITEFGSKSVEDDIGPKFLCCVQTAGVLLKNGIDPLGCAHCDAGRKSEYTS